MPYKHSSYLVRRGTCLVFESPRASWIRSGNRAGLAVVTNASDAVGARATRDIASGRLIRAILCGDGVGDRLFWQSLCQLGALG